ncbi:M23 family metallopeptidase [Actinosynnema sp. NPDC020468]|uniref:M23 family metallopeptidase n=1 Tax=Actinosynnema sp. NPDC020468 TaxID=3154488 RepID=UPI0033EBEAEA
MTTLLLLITTTPSTARPPRFAWPLHPPHPVLTPFARPPTPYAAGHRGVDLGAPTGAPVLASADGVVGYAGQVATRGVVSVHHPGGLRTTYEPVTPTTRPGQRVHRGDRIATLEPGHEGCPSTCLHWGALHTSPKAPRTYLDPLALLTTAQVRLLPP